MNSLHTPALPQSAQVVCASSPHSKSVAPSTPLSMTVAVAIAATWKRSAFPQEGQETPAKQFSFMESTLLVAHPRDGAA